MRSPLRPPLQPGRCHQRQIQQRQFLKRLRQQTILATHMNIQLRGQGFLQMAGLLQIQQMLLEQSTAKHKLIQG